MPVDLAPANIETQDIRWASNTTLEQNSDFYVANRGNNTIVRMRQDGTVVAIRRVTVGGRPLGGARLNGIATSADGTQIYATFTVPGEDQQGGTFTGPGERTSRAGSSSCRRSAVSNRAPSGYRRRRGGGLTGTEAPVNCLRK